MALLDREFARLVYLGGKGIGIGEVTLGMPLDDREQEILAEIERQFYEDDPDLANAVRKIERPGRIDPRLALVGVILGLISVGYFFTRENGTLLALAGFALVVLSATTFIHGIRVRGWWGRGPDLPEGGVLAKIIRSLRRP